MGSAVICTTCGAMWPEYCRCIATVSNTSPSPYFAELLSLRAEVERLRTELREHCELAKSSNQEHADIEAAWRAEVERLRQERRWRDATTEPPNNDGAYSCLWWTGDVSTEYWYHDTWLGAADHVVTHWMPLPTLPEKDEPWRSTNNHYDDWPL